MGFHRFEDLPVWRAAIDLAKKVFALTATGCLKNYSGLKDQIERAVVSISNNIAEGFERGTDGELLTFLYYAKGSAGEVRSMFHLIVDCVDPSNRRQVEEMRNLAENISRQLGAWIGSIQDGERIDPRRQNSKTRELRRAAQRQSEYQAKLRRIVEEHRHQTPEPPSTNDGDS